MTLALSSRRAALSPGQWVRNELWRRARAVPSLDLRFAESKSLRDSASGSELVTFTRASSGTFVGSDGVIRSAVTDVPRFDHNPTTGESLGLLVEEARTNLLTYSELFNAGPWISNNLSIASTTATAAPTGTNTAIRITENTAASVFHFLSAVLTKAASAIQYTFSIYGKAGERELTFSMANGTTGAVARFNLATGVITAVATAYGGGFTAQSATMTSVGNGWYRCTLTFTTDATTGLTAQVSLYNTTLSTNVYTGDGTSGIYVWGAQLEAGAFPTSYIPTTTATVTRSADVASITGSAFSSWYSQSEGTMFADINTAPVANIAQAVFDLSEGAGLERIFQRRNTGGFVVTAITDNNVVQGDFGSVSVPASGRARSGLAYRLNDFEAAVNGSASGTDTSATVPTPDRIHMGQNFASGQAINGTIRRLTYWPTRLSNSTLQSITQ